MTSGFLDAIVAEIRAEIRAPGYLGNLPASAPHRPASFRSAVERERGRGALLVEYKRVSPGQPDPRLPAQAPEEFVRRTTVDGVAGYSCLATKPRFEGSPAHVAEIVRATTRPVLFKDFVIEPEQIDAAERAGASAVLLIARLERGRPGDPSISDLAARAHARGLEVLLEFHDSAELRRADDVPAEVYGVNARDLDTLTIDRNHAVRTLEAAGAAGLRPLLGLSGVDGPAPARRFWEAGADGILVGTAVARSADPAGFLSSLRRSAGGYS